MGWAARTPNKRLESMNLRIWGDNDPEYQNLLQPFLERGIKPVVGLNYIITIEVNNTNVMALSHVVVGANKKLKSDFTWLLNSQKTYQQHIIPLLKSLTKKVCLRAKRDFKSADVMIMVDESGAQKAV